MKRMGSNQNDIGEMRGIASFDCSPFGRARICVKGQ
jgi:hypothetical protein